MNPLGWTAVGVVGGITLTIVVQWILNIFKPYYVVQNLQYDRSSQTFTGRIQNSPYPLRIYAWVYDEILTDVPDVPHDDADFRNWGDATGDDNFSFSNTAWPTSGDCHAVLWLVMQIDRQPLALPDPYGYASRAPRTSIEHMTPQNVVAEIPNRDSLDISSSPMDATGSETVMLKKGVQSAEQRKHSTEICWTGPGESSRSFFKLTLRESGPDGRTASKLEQFAEEECIGVWENASWDFVGANRLEGQNGFSPGRRSDSVHIRPVHVSRKEPAIVLCGEELLPANNKQNGAVQTPYCFVTVLNESYVPGFLALVKSLKRNARIPFRFTVILLEELAKPSYESIQALGIDVECVPKHELGTFQFDPALNATEYQKYNYDKILIWLLDSRETMCFLDADLLCLNSLEGIEEFSPMSVVGETGSLGLQPGEDANYRLRHMYPWNSGFMVFQPDRDLFEEIQAFARTYVKPICLADQVILVDYFGSQSPDAIQFVDAYWNMGWLVAEMYPQLFRLEQIRLLHYYGLPKPWMNPSPRSTLQTAWSVWKEYDSMPSSLSRLK